MYKVLIASAGLGTRLGDYCKNLNKALVSIAHKPIISYIIDKFPDDIEIVIAVGYKKEILKEYLSIVYPDRKITFVDIDNYEGDGSGLGYTILQCKDHLQCPFIFTSNDTFVIEAIPDVVENWIAFAFNQNIENYRTIRKKTDVVVELLEKRSPGFDLLPYIGLAGIKDYETFWKEMEEGRTFGSITEGEAYALKKIIKKTEVKAVPFTWYDAGNTEGLERARNYFKDVNQYNILDKTDEAIWFVNGQVIKYSADTDFISKRVERALLLKQFVPEIIKTTDHTYAYRKITGNVLSKTCNAPIFQRFLSWMQKEFWIQTSKEDDPCFSDRCYSFYKTKTFERIKKYFNRFVDQQDTDEVINGVYIPSLSFILKRVDWDYLCNGLQYQIHGDLHFENILLGEDGKFYLLDWRQDFADNIKSFDIYYDLAKLYHGLIVSHDVVHQSQFKLSENENIIEFDIPVSIRLLECQKILDDFITKNNFDLNKVKLLTSIVFLNNAPLHDIKYAKFLYYLGKYLLWNNIE